MNANERAVAFTDYKDRLDEGEKVRVTKVQMLAIFEGEKQATELMDGELAKHGLQANYSPTDGDFRITKIQKGEKTPETPAAPDAGIPETAIITTNQTVQSLPDYRGNLGGNLKIYLAKNFPGETGDPIDTAILLLERHLPMRIRRKAMEETEAALKDNSGKTNSLKQFRDDLATVQKLEKKYCNEPEDPAQ
jgi:hypothetical protein